MNEKQNEEENDNSSSESEEDDKVSYPVYHNKFNKDINLSYGSRPSVARLIDRERNQFVLLTTRSGGLVNPSIALEVINEISEWENRINQDREALKPHQYLKLRGVWWDDAHGVVTIFIQLLHDFREKPILNENDLKRIFHDGYSWYGDQIVTVEVSIKEVNTYSDYFWPILDEYYDWIEEGYSFEKGNYSRIMEALLDRLSKEAYPVIYNQIAQETILSARKYPTDPLTREDVKDVIKAFQDDKDNLPLEASNAFPLNVLDSTYTNLNSNRQERLRQAKFSFNTALALAGFGVVIIIVGIILLFYGYITAGTITTGAGILPEVIGLLLFKFNKETNDRLDKVTEDLNLLDKTRMAIRMAEQIADSSKRDKAIANIIKELNISRSSR